MSERTECTCETWDGTADCGCRCCLEGSPEEIVYKRDLSEAIRLLREVEWRGHDGAVYGEDDVETWDCCPVCNAVASRLRHAPDCALAALLAKYSEG